MAFQLFCRFVEKKRKHCPYKPGFVPRLSGGCLSSIYNAGHPAPPAFYPPSYNSGGQPSDDGIHELAAPSRHSPMITHRLVVSYTSFSPLPCTPKRQSGHSLLPAPTVTNSFHFQKWGTLCCPDFPPVPYDTSDRPEQCFRLQR